MQTIAPLTPHQEAACQNLAAAIEGMMDVFHWTGLADPVVKPVVATRKSLQRLPHFSPPTLRSVCNILSAIREMGLARDEAIATQTHQEASTSC